MNRLEQRIERLEGQGKICKHRSPVVLANPTEEEVERRKKELAECPNRSQHGNVPKLVIMRYPDLN